MCCEARGHRSGYHCGHHPAHFCGCASFHPEACFPTREEKIARLERHLEGLQEAAREVEERIAVLKEG